MPIARPRDRSRFPVWAAAVLFFAIAAVALTVLVKGSMYWCSLQRKAERDHLVNDVLPSLGLAIQTPGAATDSESTALEGEQV